jgi:uncharacterized protein YoxC
MAGFDKAARLSSEYDAVFKLLDAHGAASFKPFDVDASNRGQLAQELASYHRGGLVTLNKPHDELEESGSDAVVATSRTHAKAMKKSWEACDGVEKELKGIVGELDNLLNKHRFVTEKTRTLREACESLKAEKAALEQYHEQLTSHTQHFAQLEAATAMANKPPHAQQSSGPSKDFVESLRQIEAAVVYFEQHPEIANVEGHVSLLRNAVLRSLTGMRDSIVQELKNATKVVLPTLLLPPSRQ